MLQAAVQEVGRLVKQEGGAGVAARRGLDALAAAPGTSIGMPQAAGGSAQPDNAEGSSRRHIRTAALRAEARMQRSAVGVGEGGFVSSKSGTT